jgi:hypothetical protein
VNFRYTDQQLELRGLDGTLEYGAALRIEEVLHA